MLDKYNAKNLGRAGWIKGFTLLESMVNQQAYLKAVRIKEIIPEGKSGKGGDESTGFKI